MSFAGEKLDCYDNGNGSVTLEWIQFTAAPPDSYNLYVDGALARSGVLTRIATLSGFAGASYNGTTITPPQTHRFHVTAVVGGVEVARSNSRTVTILPTSTMLVTRMRRPLPFPDPGSN